MNLNRLRAFRAVAQTGSVTKAAERLHMTQPGVSRLLSELERELGLLLFARERQRLLLTPEGQMFLQETQRALAAVDEIVEVARDIRTLKGAHIRIVTHAMTAFGIVPAATKILTRRHPQVRITVEIKDLRDIPDWIARGPFDIGLAYASFDDPRVENEPLATLKGMLVLPKGHRLARRRIVSVRDLKGERMVLPPVGNPDRVRIGAAFESAGVALDGAIDTGTAFSACQFVAAGLGLAIIDPLTFRVASSLGLTARPFRPSVPMPVSSFFPAGRPRSAVVQAFNDAARTAVQAAT
jgi:DNA-binding transcriptional LysR family regulator